MALVAEFIDQIEQVGVEQLADIGLMALGHAGDLQVADAAGGQVMAQFHCQVALDDLAVVQVHLHFQIRGTDLFHDVVGRVLVGEKVAGHVARVDRLDHQFDAVRGGLRRRPGQVGDEGVVQARRFNPSRRHAGHHMHARATQRARQRQRLLQQREPEVGFAPRQAGQAALASLQIARWRVDQHLLQPVRRQPRRNLARREVIGEGELHRTKAVGRGRGEAVEERRAPGKGTTGWRRSAASLRYSLKS